MEIRRAILHAVLALLLLLSQQMGVAHAVTHLARSSHSVSDNKQLPVDQSCEKCLAFSQIGSALTDNSPPSRAHGAASPAPVAVFTQQLLPKAYCVFLSRAPPSAV